MSMMEPETKTVVGKKTKRLQLIHVPFGLGAGRAGTELGPGDILHAGLVRQIRSLGHELADDVWVSCADKPAAAPAPGEKLKHFAEVVEMSRNVCTEVSAAVEAGAFPLVLGGDHSIAIGTLAGLTAHYPSLGVIWIDAHTDMNTEATTHSGNMHGMSLAIALGKLRSVSFADILGAGPSIKKENIVIVAARDIDPGERELIRKEGIACFTMHDIDRLGIHAVMEKALAIAGSGTDGVHLSFDIDSVDPIEAPGVGTPVRGGLSYREAHFALELLAESGLVTSMEVVEVNSLLDQSGRTARLAVELIASMLGKRII
ncbi:arginase [Paenibacillus tarimensis]|uniref:arginase n=1 Tax=Paenibacillus tarimensis TaxID=416012 RepID=UPI001F22320B|nr:arginase [Paenibacillus tarimensis]MCF2945098.1 arginase [Paenibacillus tarimensis]